MKALSSQQFEKSCKSRKQFEIKFMSDIESSLNGALENLNAEKVGFRLKGVYTLLVDFRIERLNFTPDLIRPWRFQK